jgi:hypothetical protein
MNPLVGASLAHAKESGDDFLQGIDFEVKQNEEQLIFDGQQMGFATATIRDLREKEIPECPDEMLGMASQAGTLFCRKALTSFARLFVSDMLGDISFPGLFKRDQ